MKKFLAMLLIGTMVFRDIPLYAESLPWEPQMERNAGDISRDFLFDIALAGVGMFVAGMYLRKNGKKLQARAQKAYVYAFDNYWIPDGYDSAYLGYQTRVNRTYERRIVDAERLEKQSDNKLDYGKLLMIIGAQISAASLLGLTLSVRSNGDASLEKEIRF